MSLSLLAFVLLHLCYLKGVKKLKLAFRHFLLLKMAAAVHVLQLFKILMQCKTKFPDVYFPEI